MVAGTGRENGMETPMHENPEWEKARQALASISKAGAAGSSKASSNGPVASAQVRRPQGWGALSGTVVGGLDVILFPLGWGVLRVLFSDVLGGGVLFPETGRAWCPEREAVPLVP